MALRPLASLDVWWHLSMGRGVVEAAGRRFPDPVGPEGREYVDPEWLYDLLLYGVHGVAGVPGIVLLTALLAALSALAIATLCDQHDSEGGLVLAALGVAGTTFHFTGRPQAAFLVLLPLVMWAGKTRRMGLLVLAGLLWTQCHSSMVLLPLVAGLCLWPLDRRGWVTVAVCAALVLVAGPFGLDVVPQVLGHAEVAGIEDMSPLPAEGWLPWGLLEHRRSLSPLILEILLLGGLVGALRARRVNIADVGLALLGLAMALSARRFIPAGCVLALPFAAPLLSSRLPRSSGLLALVLLAAYGSWLRPPSLRLDPSSVPVGAAEVLAGLSPGQLFNDYDVGGYLGWATPHRVSIDGRTPTHFSAEEFQAALAISEDPARFFALEADYAGVVVDRRSPLCRALSASAEWGGAWSGEQVAVFLPGAEDSFPVCVGANEMLAACREGDLAGLERMISAAPSSHHARRLAALHLIECGARDLDRAEALLLEAEAIQPTHVENSWVRGMLAFRRGDFDDALFWLDRAGDHPPSQRAREVIRNLVEGGP
ncbi:MAG TPA: hypothetical protein QGF58_07600 [Myxococcota bacterium]|nr:hypothetical protein [Myxococcota bacterium]